MRAVPAALAAHRWGGCCTRAAPRTAVFWEPSGAAALYLRAVRQPLAPFFDRVAIGVGLTFALVRTGCFLAGCDYGLPTGLPWGVRFPHGSLAALDHARRGFVPHGAAACRSIRPSSTRRRWGLLGSAGAAFALRRDAAATGRAFATLLAIYAAGRFGIELLRGDQDRGSFSGLSTGAVGVGRDLASAVRLVAARAEAGSVRRRLVGGSGTAFGEPLGEELGAARLCRINREVGHRAAGGRSLV